MYIIVSCLRTNSLYWHKSVMVNAGLDKYRNKHQPRHVSLPVCFLCLLWIWKAGSSKLLCMFIFPQLAGLIGFRCLGSDWKRFFWKWNLTSTFFCQFQFLSYPFMLKNTSYHDAQPQRSVQTNTFARGSFEHRNKLNVCVDGREGIRSAAVIVSECAAAVPLPS